MPTKCKPISNFRDVKISNTCTYTRDILKWSFCEIIVSENMAQNGDVGYYRLFKEERRMTILFEKKNIQKGKKN